MILATPTTIRQILLAAALGTIAVLSATGTAAAGPRSTPGAQLFVDPVRGNDNWDGASATHGRGKRGPFRTLARAQSAARAARHAQPATAVTVQLREGRYALKEPLIFTSEDSGTTGSEAAYSAYRDERPVVSGGIALSDWCITPNGWWETSTLVDVSPQHLYADGRRCGRPRLPKSGYFTVADALAVTTESKRKGPGFDRFVFRQGDLDPSWSTLRDVEILGFHVWSMSRLRIESIDAATSTVTFTGTTHGTEHFASFKPGGRYLVENVGEALSEPGSFYADDRNATITYVPRPGESPKRTEVIVPWLEQLMILRGTRDAPITHLSFRGISFAHTAYQTPDTGSHFPQAAANEPAAIHADYAHDVRFENCRISNTGAWAMEFLNGCQNCRVTDCDLVDLGAGGMKFGPAAAEFGQSSAGGDPKRQTFGNRIERCLLAHGGRNNPAGTAIFLAHSHDNVIAHNSIIDFYYTGISAGWVWGYGESLTYANRIADNRITDIGQRVLSDMGAIYTLGISPGTVIERNLIERISSFGYGGWGIYFDEGSTSITARHNIVNETKSSGFHQHYGRDNILEENVFAYGEVAQLARTRAEAHLSFRLERNVILYDRGKLLDMNWTDGSIRMNRNLYWNEGENGVEFKGERMSDWSKRGHDADSLVADPRFIAPHKGDFRLQPNSPVTALGIEIPDLRDAGCGRMPPCSIEQARTFPTP